MTTGTTLDRLDERYVADEGASGAVRGFWRRVRSGDIGALPVVVGLAVIWTVFQSLNPVFLSSNNLVNLLYDSVSVGVIALGIVCVLVLGQIDLSVGSVSGMASALLGVLWVQQGLPPVVAVACGLAAGAAIGLLYAVLHTRFAMPSFVATLAGLLAFLGLQLTLLGDEGSINLPFDSFLVRLGQVYFVPQWLAWLVVAAAGVGSALVGWRHAGRRREAGLSAASAQAIGLRSVALTVVLGASVLYLYTDRGLPWTFLFFAALVLAMHYAFTRTQWGRSMMAVGGNREAARRAGIDVRRITTSAFVLCSTLAALGGMLAAARLASASQQAGTGDVNLNAIAAAVIGGTSLFGGRGSAISALLGILVIQSISNGLTLLDLSSSLRFMITGAVLAIAVLVDSLARRSRAAHGAA